MKTGRDTLKVAISLGLAVVGFMLGWIVPGLLLADFGPSLGLRLLFAALPLAIIPFLIGWLTPSLWWLGVTGAVGALYIAFIILVTSGPLGSPQDLLFRLPLLVPLVLVLAFAFLGRVLSRRTRRARA